MHREKSSHRRFKNWGWERLNIMLNGKELKEMGVAHRRERTEGYGAGMISDRLAWKQDKPYVMQPH